MSAETKKILREVAHRPWAMPRGRWVMAQSWHDLLFAHWPVAAAEIATTIPAGLTVDTFDGRAWIGVVPFRMAGVRLWGTPALPGLSAFPELNVRTYVTAGGKPGVWFFSLDAANEIAVKIARSWFGLPYFRARMSCEEREGWIEYRSERIHEGAASAELTCRYRPSGEMFLAEKGTLEHFLTERYCLYAVDQKRGLMRGEIQHPAWKLQAAEIEIARSTMAKSAGFGVTENAPELVHFAKRQDVVVWSPQRVNKESC